MPACLATPQFAKRGELYRCLSFEEFRWLEHGFSTRKMSLPASITTLRQIHSANVLNVRGLDDRAAEGDALVSNELRKRIGVRTADCVPILMADPATHAVAAIHAGWRGTAAAIARRTLDELAAEFGTKPDDVHAAIGPAIRVCCYEVGAEVALQFRHLFPEWQYWAVDEDRWRLDLIEANRRILAAAGVPSDQIHDCGLCTRCCAPEFHSFRRDPTDPGRMVSFIGRND
jgi:polyphenol oxidase